jgi:ubiquinol-cytochrome c reductase cytochrome b subunit
VFGALVPVPWIERRLTGDDREHHLLDRPRDAPMRTAVGAAAITFVGVLFLGGSQDVIAGTFDISVGHVTTILQISALLAPPIVGFVTVQVCRSLRGRGGPTRTERASAIERRPDGGYHDAADAAEPAEAAIAAGAGDVFASDATGAAE